MMSRSKLLDLKLLYGYLSLFTIVSFVDMSFGYNGSPLNCSELCSCKERNVKDVIHEYGEKHALLAGKEYTETIADEQLGDKYLYNFKLGPFDFSYLHSSIAEVTCQINTGNNYSVADLLNGIHTSYYTALTIKCSEKEDIIWDVGHWRTTINILSSENCHLRSISDGKGQEEKKDEVLIRLPVNIWIAEIHQGGENVIQNLDISFAMNMFALIVTDSSSDVLPTTRWNNQYLISANVISLIRNHLDTFSCSFILTNNRINAINLEGNDLTAVPECLVDGKLSITYLTLAHNIISNISVLETCLPDMCTMGININSDIDILDLSYNNIQELKTLRGMRTLQTLDLSHNFIKDIGQDTFSRLPKLKTLYLHNNLIHSLVDFVTTDSLHMIDLSYNHIEQATLAKDWSATRPLVLKFRNNRFRLPPFFDCENTSLPSSGVQIYASGNKYSCGCQAIPFQKCKDWIDNADKQTTKRVSDVFVDIQDMLCDYPIEHRSQPYPDTSLLTHCVPDTDCPTGCLCYLEGEILTVNCSGRHLLEIPPNIPLFETAKSTKLYLDHNPIQTLGWRHYLHRITELYLHDCLLSSVAPNTFENMLAIERLHLHRNLLQKFPTTMKNISFTRAKNITLHSNRWACTCDQLWLPEWMEQHHHAIFFQDRIVCRHQKIPVLDLSPLDTDCKETSLLDEFIMVLLFVLTMASTASILLYYRSDINQLFFLKFGVRLWQPLSYGDAYLMYDAFLFYSQSNYKWVVDYLVHELESGPNPYRLCLHFRDFPKHEVAINNIPLAVHLSRCFILVLCTDFFENEWNVKDLRILLKRQLQTSHSIIIVVMEEAVLQNLPDAFLEYMKRHEFLLVDEPYFRHRLNYLLPPPRLSRETDGTLVSGKGPHFPMDIQESQWREHFPMDIRECQWRAEEESTLREQGDIINTSSDGGM